MADDGLRFEAWTWPLVGTLTKKFDFTKWIDSYTINDRFNDLCDGTITLSDDFPKKDQIFFIDETNHALDVGSMVRVLRGTTPIAHFLVTRSEDAWADGEPTHKLTLEGLEWILDRTTVPHYDYPADPTVEPDWIYGADTLLANAYLEDSPESKEVQHFYHTQGAGTYTITYSGQTTSALAFGASWFDVHQALEALSNIQDVVVTGAGTAASPFEIEFLDPSGDAALLTTTATGASIVSNTEGGVPDPAGWTKSFHPQTGEEHGEYTDFEVSADQNHTTAGTYSLKVVAAANTYPTDYPGVQQIQNVTGGRTYRGEIWVYSTTTADYRFILRTMDETAIDGAMVEQTVTANTWTKLTIPPFEVPQHISQVIFRLGLIGTGGGTFYVDDGVFAPGFPAAALGFIMNDLRTACLAQGTLGWITPTWTTTTDTDGAAWDQDLKWLVNHDQTILQLFEYMRQWNYEWRIRWDVADNRFEWDMWNPLGGGQTRANIAITGKSGVTQGNPIVKRPPGATYVRVEGELGRWGENASTTLDDVWGRLEKAVNDRQGVDSLQLDTFATRLVVREGTDTAGRAVTVEDPTILPWQAYEPGDTVTLNLAPKDTKQALRVVALVASMAPGQATPRYDVHFVAPVLSNEAAMAQGLRTLWRKFNAFRPNTPAAKLEPPAIAGKGGMATVLVAAANASEFSKRKADFVCTGINDNIVIQAAIDAVYIQAFGGLVWLSEGQFFLTASLDVKVGLRGLGQMEDGTELYFDVTNGDVTALEMSSRTMIADMYIEWETDGTTLNQIIDLGAGPCWVDHLRLEASGASTPWTTDGTVIYSPTGDEQYITNVEMEADCPYGIQMQSGSVKFLSNIHIQSATQYGLLADSGQEIVIQNMVFEQCGTSDDLTTGSLYLGGGSEGVATGILAFSGRGVGATIEGTWTVSGMHIECSGESRGVQIDGSGGEVMNLSGISVEQATAALWVETSFPAAPHDDINISGFVFRACGDGIVIVDTDDVNVGPGIVSTLGFEPFPSADDTFDAIRIEGSSSHNYIHGVKLLPKQGVTFGGAVISQWRYAFNIAGTENRVVGNDYGDSAEYATGVLNDTGTGTMLVYPNHATFGDNFGT